MNAQVSLRQLRLVASFASAFSQPALATCDLPMFGGACLFPSANQAESSAVGDFTLLNTYVNGSPASASVPAPLTGKFRAE